MARTVEGLVSTYDLDHGGDVIEPGAYKRTLEHWKRNGKRLPLIDQHDYSSVGRTLGHMVDAKETDAGLWAKFELLDDDPAADAAFKRIRSGAIDAFSIGYETKRSRPPSSADRKAGVRRILEELALREVSLVIWGMNEDARVTRSGKARIQRVSDGRKTYYLDIERELRRAEEDQKRRALAAVERAMARVEQADSDSGDRTSAARTTRHRRPTAVGGTTLRSRLGPVRR